MPPDGASSRDIANRDIANWLIGGRADVRIVSTTLADTDIPVTVLAAFVDEGPENHGWVPVAMMIDEATMALLNEPPDNQFPHCKYCTTHGGPGHG